MNSKQRWLTGMTVGVSCAAMAGGFLVTSQAMASEGTSKATAVVGAVAISADGIDGADGAVADAYQCSFEGVDLGALPEPPLGVPADADVVTSGVVVLSGSAEPVGVYPSDVEAGQGVEMIGPISSGTVTLDEDGTIVAQTGEGVPPELIEAIGDQIGHGIGIEVLENSAMPIAIDAENVRQGTDEECAAMRDGMFAVPTAVELGAPIPAEPAVRTEP